MNPTPPAYQATKAAVRDVDFYRRLAHDPDRGLMRSFVIPIRSGRAGEVPAGHICCIVIVDGPEVGDLNVWNRVRRARRLAS